MVYYDREVVSTLCSELNAAMDALNEIVSSGEEDFMADRHIRGSAKYHLLVAIEAVIDLSSHLITHNSWRLPEDYADTFLVVAENGIISRDEALHLADMAKFRNRLVHQYWRINDDVIWEILLIDRNDIVNYAEKILTELNKKRN